MENIPAHENPASLNNISFTDIFDIKDTRLNNNPERRFNFKIKVTQTDLTRNDDFYRCYQSLNDSNVPFMVQYSGYIEKLNFMNGFGGADLAEERENINVDGGFGERIFQADIVNPEVLKEVERKQDEMFREMVSGGATEDFINDLLEEIMEKLEVEAEEWEFEEVDIPSSLYMFDMVNGGGFEQDYEDEFDDGFVEADPDPDNRLEVKFNSTGSIKFLEDNILEVKYDESDMTGVKDAFVRFLFDSDKKDCVTIHRVGHSDTWLNCEKGERISGIVKSRNNMTVDTKEIINNMTIDGGQLLVSYIRETNGSPYELVTHLISASPVRE